MDVFNHFQEMSVESEDHARLLTFRNRWCELFSEDNSWEDFSNNCVTFAAEAKDLATELRRPLAARNPLKVKLHLLLRRVAHPWVDR